MNKLVKESLYEFNRSNNPKEVLGIGKYVGWRKIYNNKPIITITILFEDNYNKIYTYTVDLMYGQNLFDKINDSIYFAHEFIFAGEGLNKIPIVRTNSFTFFNRHDDAQVYANPLLFNSKIIDVLENQGDNGALTVVNKYSYEWFNDNLIIDYFKVQFNKNYTKLLSMDVIYNNYLN